MARSMFGVKAMMHQEMMLKEDKWQLKYFLETQQKRKADAAKLAALLAGEPYPPPEAPRPESQHSCLRSHSSASLGGGLRPDSQHSGSDGCRRSHSSASFGGGSGHGEARTQLKTSASSPELPAISGASPSAARPKAKARAKPVVSQLTRRLQYRRKENGGVFSDAPYWKQ
mmetsp:Transcript_71890/g.181389  ORF Transcript_71890/g.181389 Transcript_71890/m.181389 type:complete len:171 (+) Transcript_71890:93-605(+)